MGRKKSPMKRATQPLPRILLFPIVSALLLGATTARAEMDYEFARMLIERDEPSFSTGDLVERLIINLEQNPASKIDGKLARATWKRRQSEIASPAKRKGLLDEAEALYKEIMADPKHRLFSAAEKDASTIINDRIKATKKAAKDLDKTDAAMARSMRADAAEQMQKIASTHKAATEAALPPFMELHKKYKEWSDKNDSETKQPPRDLIEPLEKKFDEWIIADKKYVHARTEQLECYDDTDPAKKTLAEELGKYCEEKVNNEILSDFPVITSWYSFMLGKIHAAVQNEVKATEAWSAALNVEATNMGEDQRKQIAVLQKFILHDLVKMKMKSGKYGDVEGIVVDAMLNQNLKSLFDEDVGKDLLVDYAKALTLPVQDSSGATEFEKAIKKLREMIEKETGKGANTIWANQFARTMAEILLDARKKNVRPRLSADEWYSAARGFFLMGQQEHLKFSELEKEAKEDPSKEAKAREQYEKAYTEFENATDYFRRAISAAREERTPLATRVEIEPKAWFEMGFCYLKMKHYYEAIIAYQAMRASWTVENRKRWLPDVTKEAGRKLMTKAVQDMLADLDKGILSKINTSIMYGLDENARIHPDLWNRALKPKFLGDNTDVVPDKGITDIDYLAAKSEMEIAKTFADLIKMDPKNAESNAQQAFAKYMNGGDKFMKVKTTSAGYELALYQAGSAYTLAQGLWATGKLKGKTEEETFQQGKDVALKALAAFDKYDACVAATPPKLDEDKERRAKLEGAVLLARNTLYSGARDWPQAVKSADNYVAWEMNTPQDKTSVDIALLNKFRALIELGAINVAPGCDPYLKDAETAMREIRKLKPTDNKLYIFMINALTRRYNIAAFQAEKFIKEGKLEAGAEEAYENKVAELQSVRVEMIEDAEHEEPTLEDYARLVHLFNKTSKSDFGRQKKAADMAKKLLDKFDPEKKNFKIPDDEKVWRALLARMIGDQDTNTAGVIYYADLNKGDRCKKDHAALIDRMYDTREGVAAAETPDRRPAHDRLSMDMEKALQQLDTIKRNYPDCQTLPDKTGKPIPQAVQALNAWIDSQKDKHPEVLAFKPKGNETPKALLTIVEEEIDFRRKIEAARDLLSTLSLEVADKLLKDGKEEDAKAYREMGADQLRILLSMRGETPAMQIKYSDITIANGKYEEAMTTLYEVKANVEKGSMLYFEASKRISEVYARQGKWREAADYPEFLSITAGFNSRLVKEKWPDMEAFLNKCYDNGAQRPKIGAKKEEPKKEEQKPDEKKPDAEQKTEEKKPDAEKKTDDAAKEPAAEEKKTDAAAPK